MKTDTKPKEMTEEEWRDTYYYDMMRDKALMDGALKPNDWLRKKTRRRNRDRPRNN